MPKTAMHTRDNPVVSQAQLRRANTGLKCALLAAVGALVLHILNCIVQVLHSYGVIS